MQRIWAHIFFLGFENALNDFNNAKLYFDSHIEFLPNSYLFKMTKGCLQFERYFKFWSTLTSRSWIKVFLILFNVSIKREVPGNLLCQINDNASSNIDKYTIYLAKPYCISMKSTMIARYAVKKYCKFPLSYTFHHHNNKNFHQKCCKGKNVVIV